MPPVVVAVAAGAAAYAAGATVIVAVTIAAAAAALYTVATMDIPSTPGTDPSTAKQTIRTPNQPCRRIFGTALVGGVLTFAEEHLTKSGYNEEYTHCSWRSEGHGERRKTACDIAERWIDTSTKYLHLVVVLAAHEVEDILEVYFGDELKTDWDHEFWKINVVKGNQTGINQIPQLLRDVPSWTNKMIGKGVTFVHVALKHSAKHFPNGIPSIKCLVKGTKLNTPFYTGFGNNAAACIYHYLRHQFGATDKMINTDSFRNEFSVCNERMTKEPPVSWDTRRPIRYAIDGSFDYDESHQNILKKMLSACGGRLIFTNGQYFLQVAAYRGPVASNQVITLDNLNGPLSISPDTQLNDRINVVQGQYLDPEGAYLQADFTPVTNPAYVVEDGGEERPYDADFEFVLNKHQAHRLANIILKDNRYGLTIKAPMNLSGFKFNAGLLVGLDDKSLGYDQLEFRIVNWRLDPKGGVQLTLKQTAADIYDDSTAPVTPKPPSTEIPDPRFCYPVERVTFDTFDDDGVYDGLLWWSHPDLSNVREFEVVAATAAGEILRFNVGKNTEYRLQNMSGVVYNITVTAFNLYGAPSSPVTIVTKVGDPKPVTGVVFEPDNFEVVIRPTVSGVMPMNTRFAYFRANTPVPAQSDMTEIGEGVTFTDVGLIPNTTYHYYIQPLNGAAAGDLFGPYGTKTTDNPDDIYDLIKDEIPGTYTWVVYATDAFGAGISKTFDPATHHFEGRAYNKSVEEPSLNPLDYTFFRIGEFISDAEQDILDNLAQGKLPDGSADLVKPSDVLFKPGDAAEGIINNLEQGKLPDGSADLVKPSDVLFKPGDAAEGIINNLEQGKLPDGSDDLVKPSDVLFKPGDEVQETNIANGSISTPKIKTNAITADKITANAITTAKIDAGAVTATEIASKTITAANIKAGAITATELSANSVSTDKLVANAITTAKINAGAVTATEIAANAVTADKILANSVTASKIQANAITADKIAVTVVSPINNYSEFGETRGWTIPVGANLADEALLDGKVAKTLKIISGSVTKEVKADRFSIDHNAIYEMRFSIYSDQTTSAVDQRLGVRSFDSSGTNVPTKSFHPVTLDPVTEVDKLNIWEGSVVNGWRHMVAYIVGANADISAVPKSLNVNYIAKLTADVRQLEMFTEVVASGNASTIHFYSPSVIKIGSGLIVANEIRAGSLITAPTIEGGLINGTRIEGATGYFSGDVEAGRVVGVVGSATQSQRSFVTWATRRSTGTDYEIIGRVKVRRENFDRTVVVTAHLDSLRFNGNFTGGVRQDFPSYGSFSKTTRLVPKSETISSKIQVDGFRSVVLDYAGYHAANSQSAFLVTSPLIWTIKLKASADNDNTVDSIPIYLGLALSSRADYTTRYSALLGGSSITAVISKDQASEDLTLTVS